ncbi:MAG: nitroreductase family protein [Bacteroidaceae bacterium]|nr:nitroreductase family protein [Bacteroidaceae bacterium]
MQSFAEIVQTRRSMRKYTDEQLTPEQVETLLRSALMSPSSKGKHAWHFIVVDDKAMLTALSGCKAVGSDFVKDAALAIVVVGDPQESDVWIEDACVAATVLLYQAEDLGLGACWVQLRNRTAVDGESTQDIVRKLLNIPDDLQPAVMVALGHKGMERKPFNPDRLLWEKVHIGGFENSRI